MTAAYRLDLKNASGMKFAEISDFSWLSVTKQVNAPGLLQVKLRGDHSAITSLSPMKTQVELYRADHENGIGWGRYFGGWYMAAKHEQPESFEFTLTAPGYLEMVGRRVNAFYAGSANKSEFTSQKAEFIAKTLVRYNCSASATTANGRLRDGTNGMNGITIQTGSTSGSTVDIGCAWANVLETLQKVSLIGGGDFDLVKTASATWDFRWYDGQLGTDRSGSLIFSLGFGNMDDPLYELDQIGEKTVAVVGGTGEENFRQVTIRTGSTYSASFNEREVFVDTSSSTLAGRQSAGDQRLRELQARESFQFRPSETESTIFGVDYGLGDIAKAINPWSSASLLLKVNAVTITLTPDGNESLDIELVTP